MKFAFENVNLQIDFTKLLKNQSYMPNMKVTNKIIKVKIFIEKII